MMMKNQWKVELVEDPDTKDLILQFPDEMLEKMGWTEGDILLWGKDDNGNITLTKKDKDSNIEQ